MVFSMPGCTTGFVCVVLVWLMVTQVMEMLKITYMGMFVIWLVWCWCGLDWIWGHIAEILHYAPQ